MHCLLGWHLCGWVSGSFWGCPLHPIAPRASAIPKFGAKFGRIWGKVWQCVQPRGCEVSSLAVLGCHACHQCIFTSVECLQRYVVQGASPPHAQPRKLCPLKIEGNRFGGLLQPAPPKLWTKLWAEFVPRTFSQHFPNFGANFGQSLPTYFQPNPCCNNPHTPWEDHGGFLKQGEPMPEFWRGLSLGACVGTITTMKPPPPKFEANMRQTSP